MKTPIIILSFILLACVSCKTNSTTTTTTTTKENESNKIQPPCALPLVPEYDGGDEAMFAFIKDNLVYPEAAKKNNINGVVIVSFTVLVSGEIKDVKVQQSLGFGCDEEAVRVLKLMPKWKPGKYMNSPIDMSYSLGFLFDNK